MNSNDALETESDRIGCTVLPDAPATLATRPNALVSGAAAAFAINTGAGLNPLIRAANPLLALAVPLRLMVVAPDIDALRLQLIQAVQLFETHARASRIATDVVAAARYALCTLVDEAISSTAWGAGVWGRHSLLVTFHNEAWGGEKLFLILQRLSQNPRKNIDGLELIYLCLALGLEGRYRVIERGGEQLSTLRERLLQLIQRQRDAAEQDLSLQWRASEMPSVSILRQVPLWVLAVGAAALLLILQMTYSWLLHRDSDPVYTQISAIQFTPLAGSEAVRAPTPVPETASKRVSDFLAPEIDMGLILVKETTGRSIITLNDDGLFASGSAEVAKKFEPLLTRIGDVLENIAGDVLVVGYTDNVRPSIMARFSSNFDLSSARAENVANLLAARSGGTRRYRSEGRGETEPLVINDTPEHRARNRRVEITLLLPAAME